MPVKNQQIDPKRKVLYRNFHQIGKLDVVYLVEISKTPLKTFILLFPNFEQPDLFIYEVLSDKIANKLLFQSNFVYDVFIQSFSIKFGKLWIDGYHGKAVDPRKARSVAPGQVKYYESNLKVEGYIPEEESSLINGPIDDSK